MEDEDAFTAEVADMLAQSGDDDALMVQQFERDFEDMMQDILDLLAVSIGVLPGSQSSHQRSQKVKRILASKGPNQRSEPKVTAKTTMEVSEEAEKEVRRVERRSCSPGSVVCIANCAALECPTRRDQARESANVVQLDGDQHPDLPQVIIEEVDEAGIVKNVFSECFHVQDLFMHGSFHASVQEKSWHSCEHPCQSRPVPVPPSVPAPVFQS